MCFLGNLVFTLEYGQCALRAVMNTLDIFPAMFSNAFFLISDIYTYLSACFKCRVPLIIASA